MEKVSVIFLALPDSLKDDQRIFSHRNEDNEQEASIRLEPSILLPAELGPGESGLDPEKLSWEMILAGMLRIISAYGGNDSPLPRTVIKNGDIIEPGTAGNVRYSSVPSEWIDFYRRFILTVKPEIYHEFTGASIVKARNGEFDMALEINAVLEGIFPGSPGVLLNKALILEKRAISLGKNNRDAGKENAEALEAYETALSSEPVLPDTLFNAGFFFMRLGKYKRAKDCFSRYILDEEESEISAGTPAAAEKVKQAKKIIKNISSQGLDDSSFIEAYDCINRGDNEKGLSRIREFIERRPKSWNGWFVLGWALRKLGRYGDGLEAFRKAVELGGAGRDLKNETAICFMELGDFKEARKELEQALRETSNDIKIISNLGVLALKTGRKDEAASYFRTVLSLDPADDIAKRFLDTYNQN